MEKPILQVANLRVETNHQILLENINFNLNRNETLAVIGPNGAGKTTLFRALLGLISYTGTIAWQNGIRVGYVPQRLSIDRDLPITTEEFFYLKDGKIDPTAIEKSLALLGFHKTRPYLKRKIGVLSGGELQRVLIAWALIDHPQVLLFDEPTAGVDTSGEISIYSLLHEIQKKEELTILLISHELELVYKYATKVVCLNKKSVCYGSPEEVFNNENLLKLFGKDFAFYHHH